jgi:glycosyltransferase involved in cell wall biosynthesis
MPRVSIVMPTYNRIDTIGRAIASVRDQTFQDWELIVVDDGSTDGTCDLVAGVDPRVRLIVQENQGVAGARNAALATARGDLVAFLDSDDAWTPHHLALASAFFQAFPEEHAFTSEFWEDFGDQQYLKHFRPETSSWYPETARRVGSRAFSRPAPSDDPYLWFYTSRTEVGAWARPVLEGTPYRDVFHYTGDIFQCWRWGWLMAVQPTVITRHAMEKVGPNDVSYRIASDFGYLATVCRHFRMNMFSLPGCIKHELAEGKRPVAEGHLVTGKTAVQFHEDVLRWIDELYCSAAPDDAELAGLRGFRQYLVGKAALLRGDRDVALAALERAARTYRGADATALLWLARLLPRGRLSALACRAGLGAAELPRRVRQVVERVTGDAGAESLR